MTASLPDTQIVGSENLQPRLRFRIPLHFRRPGIEGEEYVVVSEQNAYGPRAGEFSALVSTALDLQRGVVGGLINVNNWEMVYRGRLRSIFYLRKSDMEIRTPNGSFPMASKNSVKYSGDRSILSTLLTRKDVAIL